MRSKSKSSVINLLSVDATQGLTNSEAALALNIALSTFCKYKKELGLSNPRAKKKTLNSWPEIYHLYRMVTWLNANKSRKALRKYKELLWQERMNRQRIKNKALAQKYDLVANKLQAQGINVKANYLRFKRKVLEKVAEFRKQLTTTVEIIDE